MAGCLWTCVLVCLTLLSCVNAQTTICPHSSYEFGPGSVNCYRYVQSPADYFTANRTCVRDGGSMVYIENSVEDSYIRQTYFNGRGNEEFWIGLDDLDREGTFRWTNRSAPMDYLNWVGGSPSAENRESRDCVKFSNDSGWIVHSSQCGTSHLPFLCKMPSCVSNFLPYCMGQEPTEPPVEGPSIGLVVGVVVGIIIVVVIVVLVIVCALVWKFNNEVFYRYFCCCVSGKSGPAMHSLQQENQRLRHELSQHKVSVSGRFSQGMFAGELSGVPDGRGGVLPTIKQVPSMSPTIPEDRPVSMTTGNPPPLILQRSTSRVTPVSGRVSIPGLTTPTKTSAPPLFVSGQGKPLPVRPVRQSAPAFTGQLRSLPTKPTPIAEVKGQDETDSDSSTDSEVSLHQKGGVANEDNKGGVADGATKGGVANEDSKGSMANEDTKGGVANKGEDDHKNTEQDS